MIKPAIANPLGALKIPTNEKIAHKIDKIHHNTGTHHKKIANKANTNPVVHRPLLCPALTYTTCEVVPVSFFSTVVIV